MSISSFLSWAALSSALQAGRDESDKVDEAQAVQDAKARVQILLDESLSFTYDPQFFVFCFFMCVIIGNLRGWWGSVGHGWG